MISLLPLLLAGQLLLAASAVLAARLVAALTGVLRVHDQRPVGVPV